MLLLNIGMKWLYNYTISSACYLKLFYLFGYACLGFQFDSNISFKISDVYPVSYNLRDMKDSGIEYEGQFAVECWWFIDQAKIQSDNMFYSFTFGLNYLLFFIDL